MVTDENRFQLHIKPLLGEKEPKDVTPFDVDRLRIKLLKTRKPGTVKNALELLRRIINFAVKKHLCPRPGISEDFQEFGNLTDVILYLKGFPLQRQGASFPTPAANPLGDPI